ncbi:MAG: serine/threonine protein kinase [Nitrososphaerota archaeon]|nr:serine/threonine protein kinase [Nitrososphaerota archaeon]MDG6939431.1 serine/threonine protein kinase [Nitrososphaerota archaeon]
MPEGIRRAARLTARLDEEQFAVLAALAGLMARYESVPVQPLLARSGMPGARVERALESLEGLALLAGGVRGHRMLTTGLDVLALHDYATQGLLSDLGPTIGVGKESDVYEALGPAGGPYALKAFRLGRTSFREVRRKRGYASGSGHRWLLSSIEASTKESDVLDSLQKHSLAIPKLKGRSYHTILMEMELGVQLYRVRELDDADEVLGRVLTELRRAYLEAGVVNADVSEFNVLLTESHGIVVIDWPQAVPARSPEAEAHLRRDVHNIVSFFRKRYHVAAEDDAALEYVRGRASGCLLSGRTGRYSP